MSEPTKSEGEISCKELSAEEAVQFADRLVEKGEVGQAIECYLSVADRYELPPADICLRLARCYMRLDDPAAALDWATRVVDAGQDYGVWQAAALIATKAARRLGSAHFRQARKLAVLSSFTTESWVPLLQLAALRLGILLDVYQCAYGQYRQEVLNPESSLYKFAPEMVLIAVDTRDLGIPDFVQDSVAVVDQEVERWGGYWQRILEELSATILQFTFVVPETAPFGHFGAKLQGSRQRVIQALNLRLGELAGPKVALIDCERLASLVGKLRWYSPRYWHLAKMAVSPEAQPLLARHTAAVIAAQLGLSRKCLVLDLDNTLWGGVIGEDGLSGIRLGQGPEGEAFVEFQEYLRSLKERGILLAVCSKNNEADAREPFEKHPEMRLRLSDFVMFVANWKPKAENLREIARELNIGLDSLVFVDDSPAERRAVRKLLPEVDVVPLPEDPCFYVRALSDYLLFEPVSFTQEDSRRTELYRARAQLSAARRGAESLEEFYASLRMKATIGPFDDFHLPRVAQLVGKTNQFNLTTRRHSLAQLEAFARDPNCVHFYVRLQDCFADHGLVGVMIAFAKDGVLDIDTWLMSCRVIGRTVEATMLAELCRCAVERGCHTITGTYIPTSKNGIVRDIYAQFGFELISETQGTTRWRYDLAGRGPIENRFIEVEHVFGAGNDSRAASTANAA